MLRQNGDGPAGQGAADIVQGCPTLLCRDLAVNEPAHHSVFSDAAHRLQFLSPRTTQWLCREREFVGFGQSAQVKVVLSVHAGGHVDVELKHFQELALQFIPEDKKMRSLYYSSLHVFNCNILQNLAIIHIPHCLIIPYF
jgi:hypothetical protein